MGETALAHRQENLPHIPKEVPTMLDVIYRAAKDPEVDVQKMQVLMVMAREERAAEAKRAFGAAMAAAQKEMDPVRADANNPQTKSKYASYIALDNAIRPVYTKHGFALTFDTGEGAPADYVRVLCEVFHEAGHTRTYKFDIPADGKGAKGGDVMTKTHAAGSAFQYGRRYLLGGIFNITVSKDDDGNAAANSNEPISEEDAGWIKDMIERSHSDLEKFCTLVMKVESLSELTKRDMPKAREALNEALSYWQRKNQKAK